MKLMFYIMNRPHESIFDTAEELLERTNCSKNGLVETDREVIYFYHPDHL